MHRITMWIAIAVSALSLVVCYLIYANDTAQNPAVPTDNVHGMTAQSPVTPQVERDCNLNGVTVQSGVCIDE